MNRRKRTGLTIKQAFEKKKYKNIIDLIMEFTNSDSGKKIKFSRIKYALVRNHFSENKTLNNHMTEFFKISENDNRIQMIKSIYRQGKYSKKEYYDSMKLISKSIVERLKITESDKFSSEQGLRNALARLITLKIIERISDKKGYPYYIMTKIGMITYMRYMIHSNIDKNIPDDFAVLNELLNTTFALSLKTKFKGNILEYLKNIN